MTNYFPSYKAEIQLLCNLLRKAFVYCTTERASGIHEYLSDLKV